MAGAALNLGAVLHESLRSPRRWVVVPIAISVLAHALVLGMLVPAGRPELGGPARDSWSGRIRAEIVSAPELDRVAMVPEIRSEGIRAVRPALALTVEQLPVRRESLPSGGLSAVVPRDLAGGAGAVPPRRTGPDAATGAFLREGEARATDGLAPRGAGGAPGRPVDRSVLARPGAEPRFGDNAAALADGIAGSPARAKPGALPATGLRTPEPGGYAPELEPTELDRATEALLADRGEAGPAEPIDLDVKIDVYSEPGTGQRFFRMTLREKEAARLPVMAKDVLFVVDISASMRQEMLKAVEAAIRASAAGFNAGDRVNVVRLGEQVFKTFDGFVPATAERIAEAAKTVRREPGQMRGDVYGALKDVLTALPSGSDAAARPLNIYLMSDGGPSAGLQDIRCVVKDVSAAMRPGWSVCSVNPGAAVAANYLLDLLAFRNRGTFVRAAAPDGADVAILRALIESKNPVLVNVRVLFANRETDEVYPTAPADLHSGRPLTLVGRCRAGEILAVRIVGDGAGGRKKFLYTCTLPDAAAEDAGVAREWARGRIHTLAALITRDGERKEYADEISRLSDRYGLLSPYK